MSFDNLKRNRDNISKLLTAAQADSGGGGQKKSYVDERQWKPTVDKAGNGYAVIRFLPAGDGNDLPWARYWDHAFKGPTGQWYIERSLTSIGQNDPLGEMNSRLWNSGDESDKDLVRERKRRLHYVSNILVEHDPSNPQNEGKVMLFTFGKKIFDKVMDKMQPEFPGETPVNPFDFWEGASFHLKIRNVAGYRNYDKSEFANSTVLSEDESQLELIYDQMYDLNEFTDPDNYKTYGELEMRLNMVLGLAQNDGASRSPSLDHVEAAPTHKMAPSPSFTASKSPESPAATEASSDDDTMSYFARLAEED